MFELGKSGTGVLHIRFSNTNTKMYKKNKANINISCKIRKFVNSDSYSL